MKNPIIRGGHKDVALQTLTFLPFRASLLYLCVSQGNKGAVSIRLSFYGHMLCFLNCHLAAHMQYAKERIDEFEYIIYSQKFESQTAPRIVDHR